MSENSHADVVALELLLLDPAVRADRSRVLELLHPDFAEFGASGRRWDAASIADALAAEPVPEPAEVEDVAAAQLTDGVVLVTYQARRAGRGSLRSSVWVRSGDRWLLRFHQGTPLHRDGTLDPPLQLWDGDGMDDATVLRLPGGEMLRFVRTGEETAGALFEVEAVLPPRLSGPPAHWHRVEQEEFTVVEGVLRVRVGAETRDLQAGQSVVVPPGTVHAFSNPTDRPTRLITRETPAGQLQPQFEVMASSGRIPPLLRLAEVNARHGYTFFLHGLPEGPQRLLWRALAGVARVRPAAGRVG